MFRNKTQALIVLAVLTIMFLFVAYVLDAGAAVEFSEAQEGCLSISEVGWSGTAASTADEWYEIQNSCSFAVSTDGWYLETTADDLTQRTAYLPITEVAANGLCLFERTDENTVASVNSCGLHGGAGDGESLVGIFTNSGIVSFALWNDTDSESYHEMVLDNTWPAGSSSPRASMQRVGGQWYTSNSGTALDANGDTILGTPGAANELPSGNPATCSTYPDKIAFDLDMVLFEDMSTQAQITVETDLWGVGDGGSLIATEGTFTLAYVQGAWTVAVFEYEEGTSDACIDALEWVKDGTENIMQGQPSNMPAPHPSYWLGYANWLNGILQFQKSGLSTVFLPAVQAGQ
jgi:hypothetical protein